MLSEKNTGESFEEGARWSLEGECPSGRFDWRTSSGSSSWA